MSFESKRDIRCAVRERIAELSVRQRCDKSDAIAGVLLRDAALYGAKVVALFSSLADEPQLHKVIERLSESCTVVLPKVSGQEMDFYEYSPDNITIGAFGIEEPCGGVPIRVEKIDVIVVPAVAYTADGVRLGRGRGYYDRYMSRNGFHAVKIGVCFTEQIVDSIPAEPHDIKVDRVVSA